MVDSNVVVSAVVSSVVSLVVVLLVCVVNVVSLVVDSSVLGVVEVIFSPLEEHPARKAALVVHVINLPRFIAFGDY
ncbi:hypothetical protein [Haladaptatus sp. W1]|uniref:hypothetical protein n=1 Tax=Haladaptatus sp. W1 TaxID=1897478 RepID=UPI0011130102|nr:hypothetical protein [Haladaptatus sp. W1]